MQFLLVLGLCCCLVESRTVLQDIRSEIHKGHSLVRCGLHKIGSALFKHQHSHDPCPTNEDQGQSGIQTATLPVAVITEPTIQVVKGVDPEQEKDEIQYPVTPDLSPKNEDANEEPRKDNDYEAQEWHSLIDQRMGNSNGGRKPIGKKLIGVGGNCPSGYALDSRGNCREEYL